MAAYGNWMLFIKGCFFMFTKIKISKPHPSLEWVWMDFTAE